MGILTSVELFVLSIALGTDLFSMAIPIGMKPMGLPLVLRSATIFAIFHIVFILVGYYMGNFFGVMVERVGTYPDIWPIFAVENWASILGAFVLVSLGSYMVRESFQAGHGKKTKHHLLHGGTLLVLAASVSVDALAAGFSMGMMDVNLVKVSLIVGSVIFIIGFVGLRVGYRIGQYVGKRAELIGGSVLVFLGLHVLYGLLC